MAPSHRVPGMELVQEKWSQGNMPGGGHPPPPSAREKPTQLFSSSSNLSSPGLGFVLRLMADSLIKSNESGM